MNKILSIIVILALTASLFLGNVSFTKAQTVGSGSIDSGLIGFWRFSDGSGTKVIDYSGNYFNGTAVSAWWSAGKFDYGLIVNSTGNKVTVTDSSLLRVTSAFTYSAWLNLSARGDLVQKGVSAGNCGFAIHISTVGGVVRTQLSSDGTNTSLYSSTGVLPYNQFVLLTVVFDGSAKTLKYYFNGVLDVSKATTESSVYASTANLVLCEPNFIGYPVGVIDEVRLYNRSLSASEVLTLYQGVPVTVSYDVGSLVSPNGTVLVGVDQSQSFTVAAKTGYAPSTVYVDGVPYAGLSVFTLSGLQTNRTVYVTAQFIGTQEAPLTTPTLILLVIFLFFVALAFITRDAYVFSIAGIISIIFGVQLGLNYLSDTVNYWSYGIIGFGLIFFGFWLLIACLQFGLNDKGGKK